MTDRQQFEFFLLRYVPDPVRGEFVNVGVIVNRIDSTEANAIMRITRNWQRVFCLDPDADNEMFEALEDDINSRFAEGNESIREILDVFVQQLSNTLQISERSVTLGMDLATETARLMTMYVEPRASEPIS